MQAGTDLRALVFDSLEEHIAVIDDTGNIVDVNAAWLNFAAENGLAPERVSIGSNYLASFSAAVDQGDGSAREAERGILEVISGVRESFYFEYPCHGPEIKRWFLMRVTPLMGRSKRYFVISHHNITLRKLAEERSEFLAMHDPLTGLANRRYFNLFLAKEMRRCIRNQSQISVMEFDLDCFKNYNDEFGHISGDRCLIEVASVLRRFSRRSSDLAARLGGDEFALIVGNSDLVEVQTLADEIRKAVYDLSFVFGGSRRVTVSVGIASLVPQEPENDDFLLREADDALYRAKIQGRNRVSNNRLSANGDN